MAESDIRDSYDLAMEWRRDLKVQVKREYDTGACHLVFIDNRTRPADYGFFWHVFRAVPGWAKFELPARRFPEAMAEAREYLHAHWDEIEKACRPPKGATPS